MILQIPVADIVIAILAVALVALFVVTVFRKKKHGCSHCNGCPFEGKCDGNCEEKNETNIHK